MQKNFQLLLAAQCFLGLLSIVLGFVLNDGVYVYPCVAAMIVLAVYTGMYFKKNLSEPLKNLSASVAGYSGQANIRLDNSSDLAVIKSFFSQIENGSLLLADSQQKIDIDNNLLQEVFSSVKETNTLSNTLNDYILQSADGSHKQALTIASVVKSLNEMNLANLDINKSTSYAAELAQQTRVKAEDGDNSLKDLATAILAVNDSAEFMKKGMSTLLDHAKNVNDIMNVITEIADQTNLLALNAAIEAARAGEAGRGFSVVADEVRKLAEKTMMSTTGVANAVAAIQQSVKQSTQQVETTVQNVNNATQLAESCEHALREILEMAEHSADQVRTIATATEEQSASSEEIANTVKQINDIAMENEASLEEAKRSIFFMQAEQSLLSELMEKVKKEIGK